MKDIWLFDNIKDTGLHPNDWYYVKKIHQESKLFGIMTHNKETEDEFLCNDAWDNFTAKILEGKYKEITVEEVAKR